MNKHKQPLGLVPKYIRQEERYVEVCAQCLIWLRKVGVYTRRRANGKVTQGHV